MAAGCWGIQLHSQLWLIGFTKGWRIRRLSGWPWLHFSGEWLLEGNFSHPILPAQLECCVFKLPSMHFIATGSSCRGFAPRGWFERVTSKKSDPSCVFLQCLLRSENRRRWDGSPAKNRRHSCKMASRWPFASSASGWVGVVPPVDLHELTKQYPMLGISSYWGHCETSRSQPEKEHGFMQTRVVGVLMEHIRKERC